MSDNEYMRVYMLQRYRERMAWAIAQLGSRCVVCGAAQDLELDHVDPATKIGAISKSLWSCSWGRFVAEVAKCQLLCTEHHKVKSSVEARAKVKHSSVWMYRLGCRCDDCRLAVREYTRDYRRRVAQR